MLRTFEQERLELLASASSVPVVNSLSDFEHPCQALADLFTIRERLGGPEGRTLTYVGDGNNVAHSLLLAGAKVGMQVRMATPPGFEPIPQVVKRAAEIAAETGGSVEVLHDPDRGGRPAPTSSTPTCGRAWGRRTRRTSASWCSAATSWIRSSSTWPRPGVIVMHCLPAHRGKEIAAEVIDGPRSAVWDQAENRLHTQKALLLLLFDLA